MKRVHVLSAVAVPLLVLLLAHLSSVSADEAGAADVTTSPETSALGRARALEDEIARAIEKVRPSVVAIVVAGESEGEPREGQGSGVVVDPGGYVLTNWHVAGWASQVTVVMAGAQRYPATLVGQDEEGDLALLKIEGEDPFPAVELGDSDRLRVGQWVLAMGNPRGVSEQDGRATVTWGSVTALHAIGGGLSGRELFYGDSIQTDAELNPGNSGGPLFDLSGRLIGINGRIASGTRVPQGAVNANVGFAIAVNQIRRFLPLLRRGEPVRHGYLGVRSAEVEDGPGVDLVVVAKDSAAARAGLRAGDRLLAVDGEEITSPVRLTNLVSSRPAGTVVAVRLLRGGEQVIRPVTLGARSEADR